MCLRGPIVRLYCFWELVKVVGGGLDSSAQGLLVLCPIYRREQIGELHCDDFLPKKEEGPKSPPFWAFFMTDSPRNCAYIYDWVIDVGYRTLSVSWVVESCEDFLTRRRAKPEG